MSAADSSVAVAAMPIAVGLPAAVAAVNPHYVFSAEQSLLQYTVNGDIHQIDTTNLLIIDNILTLLYQRFFADIIKDSDIEPRVANIIERLRHCYPAASNPYIPDTKGQYKTDLNELENTLFHNAAINSNITELKNIIKVSTVGSNTLISDALDAFWESGFGTDKICKFFGEAQFKTIGTPGSKLDPLPKEPYTQYFPINTNISFTESFTRALGFARSLTLHFYLFVLRLLVARFSFHF